MPKLNKNVTRENARELRDIILKLGEDKDYLIQTNGGVVRATCDGEVILVWLTSYKTKYDVIRARRLILDRARDERGRILKGRLEDLIYENANGLLYDTRKELWQREEREKGKQSRETNT